MKTTILAIASPCLAISLQAQNALLNEGASVYLEASATIHIVGNVENGSIGSFSNHGTIVLTGNLLHNGLGNFCVPGSGLFRLTQSANQLIGGTNTPNFYNLALDKSAGEA